LLQSSLRWEASSRRFLLRSNDAGQRAGGTTRGWQGYEADQDAPDHRLHPGLWRLFRARLAWREEDYPAVAALLSDPIDS
jgi:hypothetical protein